MTRIVVVQTAHKLHVMHAVDINQMVNQLVHASFVVTRDVGRRLVTITLAQTHDRYASAQSLQWHSVGGFVWKHC